jgi:hypothetical protein
MDSSWRMLLPATIQAKEGRTAAHVYLEPEADRFVRLPEEVPTERPIDYSAATRLCSSIDALVNYV